MQQPNNTEEFLRLISSSHTEDKWRGLLMATGAVRNWTEEEVLAVLENIGNSFLVGLLENSEKQRDVKSNESADLISLSLSLLASSCVSHKVCQVVCSCMVELCKHMVKNETLFNNSQKQKQLVQLVVGMSYLALVLSKTIEAIRVRMLLPHMLLVVVVFFDRLREPSHF
ncbi:hypothetical protein Gasu2_06520 [Galdieria sulphuraria]|nr:hypothetical protein Gasu2_06520 [Galdieria sulphuraria]